MAKYPGLVIVHKTKSGTFYGTTSPILVKKCPLKPGPHACFNCVQRRLK